MDWHIKAYSKARLKNLNNLLCRYRKVNIICCGCDDIIKDFLRDDVSFTREKEKQYCTEFIYNGLRSVNVYDDIDIKQYEDANLAIIIGWNIDFSVVQDSCTRLIWVTDLNDLSNLLVGYTDIPF